MQTGSSSKYILAYDADCGPCTKFRRIVDILDKYERIDFISLTKADEEGLLDNIPVNVTNHFISSLPKENLKADLKPFLNW
jgi:predicted DCC family thiol-disulfide oxidoreductase YuxK